MIERIIIFIFSLILLFFCAWNYSIFLKLDEDNKETKIIHDCLPSQKYVKRGKNIGLFFLIISSILVIISAGWLFLQKINN